MLKTKPRKTAEDYMKLPEGARAELIEGEIFMSPSPKARHQRIVENLHYLLRRHAEDRNLGRIHLSPLDVHFPSGDICQPDVLFVARANQKIEKDWIRGTPDLLVEVLSPDSVERDRIVKRDLYARNRAPEYWIVDDATRSVEVFVLSGERYAPHGYFEEQDSVSTPLFPDPALPVREVLA